MAFSYSINDGWDGVWAVMLYASASASVSVFALRTGREGISRVIFLFCTRGASYRTMACHASKHAQGDGRWQFLLVGSLHFSGVDCFYWLVNHSGLDLHLHRALGI